MKISKSRGKFLVYLEKFIESDFFQDEVKKVRSELGIPQEGWALTKENSASFEKSGSLHFPKEMDLQPSERGVVSRKLNQSIRDATIDLQLNTYYAQILLKGYIFYNKILLSEAEDYSRLFGGGDLCKIADLSEELGEYCGDDPDLYENYVSINANNNKMFPLAVKIHPQATQRDVVDFVEKNWPKIEYLQSKYSLNKDSIKNARKISKNIRERNNFIYERRDLARKSIRKLLALKKIYLDEGYIGKIISLERRRRKEV